MKFSGLKLIISVIKKYNLLNIRDEPDKLIGIMYQSPRMKRAFEYFGQTIIMDSTHQITTKNSKENWKLFIMLVINGDGQNESICYFVVTDETLNTLYPFLIT